MENTCIGFIGLGLIGGSIAKTIRKKYPGFRLLAYDENADTTAQALQEHVIDVVSGRIDHAFCECDYIFLCASVEHNLELLSELKGLMKEGALLTDTGSVKGDIHQMIAELGMDDVFIGGHPMTGSELSGYHYSSDHLLENAYYILTPGGQVGIEKISAFMELIDSLGAIPMILTSEEHDYITGAVSHLPHIIAASLVDLVRRLDTDEEHMKMIAAGGFRDLTRIASSSPDMWRQICLMNHKNISNILDEYISMLVQVRVDIDNKNGDNIYELFDTSRNYRDSLPMSSGGPIKKDYVTYCDIPDETGAIATIATILASNAISIKNIGIVHNREYEEGVLRIEFYDEPSETKAAQVLQYNRYTVYER